MKHRWQYGGRRRYGIGCVVFLGLLCAGADGRAQETGPGDIVHRYVTLDAEGARLREGHHEFWALRDPTEESVEPGWDTVTVISHFTIGTPRIRGRTAHVPVTYQQLGEFSDVFRPDARRVTIDVPLVRRADGWKVLNPDIPPHVYVRTLEDHFLKMRWWMNLPEEKHRVRRILYEVFRAILFDKSQSAGASPGGVHAGQ